MSSTLIFLIFSSFILLYVMSYINKYAFIVTKSGYQDDSGVKNTDCSSRVGNPQPVITSAPERSYPSDLCRLFPTPIQHKNNIHIHTHMHTH